MATIMQAAIKRIVHPDLLRWFHAVNVPVAEVYGLTESCGPATLNCPDRIRVGTVGEPLPGMDVRIASDAEVLIRSPNVCAGYDEDPAATAALLGADGWKVVTARFAELIDEMYAGTAGTGRAGDR